MAKFKINGTVKRTLACMFTGGALFMTASAYGQEYYSDKTISFVVGYSAGNAYDATARIIAEFLPSFIPGHPTMIVQNRPGAASYTAANYLFEQAKTDGTEIGMVGGWLSMDQLFDQTGIQFDMGRFQWVGRMATGVTTTVSVDAETADSIEDVLEQPLRIGATTAKGTIAALPRLLNRTIGTQFDIVLGYKGTGEIMLAMERGEIDGGFLGRPHLLSLYPDWLQQQNGTVLVQYTRERSSEFPDVPALLELARDEEEREIFELIVSGADIGKSVIAPPGTPEEAVAILRAAFDEMTNSPEFIAEMERRRVLIDPLDGESVQNLVGEIMDTRPAIVARAAELWRP